MINSHSHFDHSGGLRAAVAEGATVVTHASNKQYFERAFATPARLKPDRLTESKRKAAFRTITNRLDLGDGVRTLQVHRIGGSAHSDGLMMVYLPAEKLLIEADAYTPLPPNASPPAQPNANHVNLIENIERLKLSVDRILPLHGRVVPLADLYRTAGATIPK